MYSTFRPIVQTSPFLGRDEWFNSGQLKGKQTNKQETTKTTKQV